MHGMGLTLDRSACPPIGVLFPALRPLPWRALPAEHELDYNVVRGGHEKAVIALYSCSGGVVSSADWRARPPAATLLRPLTCTHPSKLT